MGLRRIVLFLAVASFPLAAAAEEDWDAPVKKWIRGPVSYISAEAEEKEFKQQKTEEDRVTFIAEFWERRNPHPGDEPNLFRERFYGRVAGADQTLRELGSPSGWKSELARSLILLGQPDNISFAGGGRGAGETAPEASGPSRYGSEGEAPAGAAGTGRDGGGSGGTVTLQYADLRNLGLAESLDLVFQVEGMSYRLETRVDLGTDAIRGLNREVLAAEFPPDAVPEKVISLTPTAAPEAPVPGIVSMQRGLLEKALEGEELPSAIPFTYVADLYKAKAGKTYVAITIGFRPEEVMGAGAEPSGLHPLAAFQDPQDPENLYLYDADDLFAPSDLNASADDSDLHRFQAGDGIDPGTYTLVVGVADDDGELVGMERRMLEVPDYSEGGMQLGSLTLADSWDTTSEVSGDLKRPYILGNRKVVPHVTATYPVNGTLALYYQVYNATEGDGGVYDLRISYHFFRKRGTRYTKAGTAPPLDGVQDRVQIYELALTQWPKGEYKIKVNVTDNLNGVFVEQEVPFKIE